MAVSFAALRGRRPAHQLGHYPVQQGKPGSVCQAKLLGGQAAVFHGGHFVARALQGFLEELPRHQFVIGDKNLHPHTSTMYASSCSRSSLLIFSKDAQASRNSDTSRLRPNCSSLAAASATRPP